MLGQNLLNLLYEKNMSQKQLAIDLNIPISTLNGYINNRREPDCQTLVKLANYFRVSTDYLLGNSQSNLLDPAALTNRELKFLKHYQQLNPYQRELIDAQLDIMMSHLRCQCERE